MTKKEYELKRLPDDIQCCHEKDKVKTNRDYALGQQKVTGRLVLTIVGAVMGSVQFGYNFGVVNNAEQLIKDFINRTEMERTGSPISETALRNVWALTASIFAIGGCLGGFAGGWWATKLGRKRGCIVSAILGNLVSILMFTCRWARSYEMIIIGRLLVGLLAGIYSALTPMYLSEISPVRTRGAIGVLNPLAIVFGIFVSQVLGFPILLGKDHLWHYLISVGIVPMFTQILILPFCPESPRYLLITCHDEQGCKDALVTLRGTTDVEAETEEIRQEMQASSEKVSIIKLFKESSLRTPLLIAIAVQVSQHFSGPNGVFFYSTSLFQEAGMSQTMAVYTTSSVGGILVVMTIASALLIDRLGRRTLQLIGLTGMALFSVLITVTMVFKDKVTWFQNGTIAAMLLYIVFFSIGPSSIPWIISSELFSHGARPAAVSLCVVVNWFGSFTVGFIFPSLQVALQDFTFVPFTVLIVIFIIFTYFKVPETKGKTFEEITMVWRKDSNTDLENQNGHAIPTSDSNGKLGGSINKGYVE